MFSKALALVSVTLVGGAVAVVGCSSSSSGNGGGGDDTTQDSGPVVDAKADHVTTNNDAQTFDTGPTPDTGTTATCTSEPIPADAGAITLPLPVVSVMNGDGGVASACAAGDFATYLSNCFGSTGSPALCGQWGTGGTGSADQISCGACINGSAAGNGVLVGFYTGEPYLVQPNTIACILATDPSSTGQACAQALLNLNLCEGVSCNSCTNDGMGGGDDPTGSLVSTCAQNADTGACSSYATAFTNACTDLAADGAAAACNGDLYNSASDPFAAAFTAFGTILCGGS
jgi:hypothetical protein